MLIVHGGAWDIPLSMHPAHLEGMEQALMTGRKILERNGTALETVIACIRDLEDNPTFDAGRGSFLNAAGEVEMDAGIMVGKDLSAGAVAAIRNVAHPIDVAEFIRNHTQHVMLAGEGATAFAHLNGFPNVSTESLLVGRERELFLELKKKKKIRIKTFFEHKSRGHDTVGVVAIDAGAHIVAGTSTGGTPYKLPGRVGDSPVPGSGYYADDRFGGASSTGWGEGILRVLLARTAVDHLRSGVVARTAAERAIAALKADVAGEGGVIMLDNNGNWAFDHNTPFMAVGVADHRSIIHLSMGK